MVETVFTFPTLSQPLFPKNKFPVPDNLKFLLIITGLGVAIRLPGLGVPLFGDEATTFWEHSTSSWLNLFSHYNGPNQHSLFSFLSNISMQIFGENEISFRLPSFIAGVLVVPLTWLAGRKLLLMPQVSLLAAFLVCFSVPLFEQSQQGRGYTLTVFFALIVFITGKNFLAGNGSRWISLIFILSGICLVLLLPSNIYFLAACGTFLLVDYGVGIKKKKQFVKLFLKGLPILSMVGLAAAYLLFIYDDLQRGLDTYRAYAKTLEGLPSLEPTFLRSLEIFLHLAEPWGIPLCLIFLFGFWKLKNPVFLLIFLLHLAINLISGVQGPPRSYYYWVPFFMLMSANGLVVLYHWIILFLPQGFKKVAMAMALVILIFSPVIFLEKYFEQRFKINFVKMEEAQQAFNFMGGLPKDYLFVIPWEDRVLRHYTEKRVAENMLNIIREGNLKKIIFIGHNSLSPEKIPISGLFPETSFLPEHFKLVEQKGSLNIYDFDFLISNIIPLEKDFEPGNRMADQTFTGLKISSEKKYKLVGKESLKIENTGEKATLVSKLAMFPTIPSGDAFLFYLYARKLNQESLAGMMTSGKRKGKETSLNLLFGIFREEKGEWHWEPEHPYRNFRTIIIKPGFFWEIRMGASPIKSGKSVFREAILAHKETSYFDGMQAYILHSSGIKRQKLN